MKNLWLCLLFLSFSSFAGTQKALVLVSYYDAYGKAIEEGRGNNSETVAKALAEKFKLEEAGLEISLCPLNTIFDVSYAQIETCLKALPRTPLMIIGLGEFGCEMKVETIFENMDRTYGKDN